MREKQCLVLILLVAFLVRIATAFAFQFQPVSDYAGYERMALNLLAGKGLVDGGNAAFLSAGYPLFVLAPVYAVFGHHLLAALLANALLCTVSAWLIYLIARDAGAGKVGRLLSAGLFAVYLPSWIYAAYLSKENLMTPLMLGVVLLSLRCTARPSARIAISVGAVLGLLAITGNSGLALTPILAIALMTTSWPLPRKLATLGLAGLVAMLVVAPWLIRNCQVVGAPVLNTNGGFNLYIGNNSSADGMFVSIADTPRGATWHQLRKQGEVVANDTLKHEAIDWIKQHPAQFVTLALRKVALFWMPPVHEGEGPQPRGEALTRLAWLAQYLLICGAAAGGVVYRRLRSKNTGLLWLAVLCYTAVHMMFYVIYRYREPIMPLLIVLAAMAMEQALQARMQSKKTVPQTTYPKMEN
ncbi:MAG: glycosyltransferase family 39 protein [Pseudomonadota bacterium]